MSMNAWRLKKSSINTHVVQTTPKGNGSFHVVEKAKCNKLRNARLKQVKLFFFCKICSVLAAVVVVNAWLPRSVNCGRRRCPIRKTISELILQQWKSMFSWTYVDLTPRLEEINLGNVRSSDAARYLQRWCPINIGNIY